MHPVNQTIALYIAAWNETDPDRRRALVAQAWTEEGRYVDAHRDGTSHAAIDAMIAGVQQVFAGYRFRLCSTIEAHHDSVRFSWQAGGTEAAPLFFAGTDFATLTPDGRFRTVTGFVDAMPAVG